MRKPAHAARRSRALLTTTACLLAVVGLASPAAAAPTPGDKQPSATENAVTQIAALQDLKKSQTTAEAKVDSRLVIAHRGRSGRIAASETPALRSGVPVSKVGTVLVDIRATVSDGLLNALGQKGAAVRSVSTRYGTVRAELPLSAVNAVAARADVRKVESAGGWMSATELNPNEKPAPPVTKEEREASIAQRTKEALENRAGPVNSEGDRAHNADIARADIGISGVGVKICALSNGVDSLAVSQAAGELPAVDVLPAQAGTGDEGTAMLEIIHDVAPGAELGYATAINGDASFADNIRALRFQLGCDIIVDDIIYFKEAPFQDWIIAQAVNDVTADGALYFSSAGNEGNTVDGTSGHWEGDYVNSGQVIGKFAGHAHDFDPGPGTQIFQPLDDRARTRGRPVLLNWSDPTGKSSNDYDLYLLDAAGNVVVASQDFQTGIQDPHERVDTPVALAGHRLAVVKFSGADRYLSLTVLRGRFVDNRGLKAFTTPGVTFGHSAARGAFSTAAAPAGDPFPSPLEPGDPPNPTGPFPDAFSATSQLERFTSDGPRKVFYEADGTPITPGNVSATGGEVRQKPDITAADGVLTSVAGFDPFFGTSAAAPHAAAIAGLVLSGNPGLPATEVREALINTAIDIGAPGVDGRSGAGVVLADRVLAYTGASPQPLAVAETPKVTVDDGGEFIEAGDTATVQVPVTNIGDVTAQSTSVVLTTPTPGVTITPRSRPYGTIAKGDTVVNSFKFTVPANHEPGRPVVLNARVSFAGGFSPKTTAFPIETGRPSNETVSFAYAGAPVAIPDFNTVGASVQIPVTGFRWASKIGLSVDGATCSTTAGSTTVGIDHTFVGDLIGRLTSPSGQSAIVFSRSGAGGNNMCQAVFDDGAERPFSSVTSANAPFTGTWQPASPLNSLRGQPAEGTWTFTAFDTEAIDTGSIRAVSLRFNGYVTP